MSRPLSGRSLSALCLLLLLLVSAEAQSRKITPPLPDFALFAETWSNAFVQRDRIGLTLGLNLRNNATHIFSYDIEKGLPVDVFDLSPDFGFGGSVGLVIFIQSHAPTGAFVVYGFTADRTRKLVGFSADESGHLTRLWAKDFPEAATISQVAAFNGDGSRIFLLLKSETPTLTMLRASDGEELSQVALNQSSLLSGLFYDEGFNRVIVLGGEQTSVFKVNEDRFDLAFEINQRTSCLAGLGMMAGSHLLVAHGAYEIRGSSDTGNAFCVYDLEQKSLRSFSFSPNRVAVGGNVLFHRETGNLLVPYSFTRKGNGFFVGKSRSLEMLRLTPQGELARAFRLQLPKFSPGNSEPNLIFLWHGVQFSKSGAMAFVLTLSGRLFTFDTMTSEIVNEVQTDSRLIALPIHLIERLGVMVTGAGEVELVDVSTAPLVSQIEMKKKATIITGANFLAGARVFINGQEVSDAVRDAKKPGFQITINKGSRDFQPDEELTLVVVNRDGLASKPMAINR